MSDVKLMTSCQNSTVIVHDFESLQRDIEISLKESKFNAVTFDIEKDWIIAGCADSKLRLFGEKGNTVLFEYDTAPCQFTSVLLQKQLGTILFGTTYGSVRIYLYPFTSTGAKVQK
jgi:hypothetical protein